MTAEQREAIPFYCHGGYVEPALRYDPTTGLMHAEANEARHVDGEGTVLTGAVILNEGTQEIRSPRVIRDDSTQIAEIYGPLQLRDRNLLLTGEFATSDLSSGAGNVSQATFLLHNTSFRGSANTLERTADNRMLLDDTTFTRCDPGSNTWAFNSESMELKPDDGYGTARNVTLRIKDVPILYTPYLRFPLNNERQSGFLSPAIGHDSDGGTDIIIPYYFNLAPNYDLTYQLRSMWKRGLIHDLHGRHLSRRSVNELNLGYIHKDDEYDDRDIEDLTSAATNPGVVIPPFEEQKRWYLSLRHDASWSEQWSTNINYNVVSDVEYVEDIGGEFGTSLSDFLNPVDTALETRSATLDKSGSVSFREGAFSAKLSAQGFQSLDPLGAEQYERIPSLTANWKGDIGEFESKVKFDYTFFDKDNSDLAGPLATIGERAYTDLEVSWPYRRIWGFFIPSAGVVHRKYQLDDEPAGARANPEITTGRISLDTGLYFDRYFSWGETSMQQTLEPRLYYLHVENDFQDDLPQFDAAFSTQSYSSLFRNNRFSGYDRIGDAERVSLGVTSRFLNERTGAEKLSISIGQIYYLQDREVLFQQTAGVDPTADESPLFTQIRYKFGDNLSLNGTFEWEPDVDRSNRGTMSIKYSDKQRRILNINYTYTAPEIQQPSLTVKAEESDINLIWPVYGNWSAIGRWNFGWDDNRTIEAFAGLEYNDCCYKTRLVWRRFLKDPRNVVQIIDDPTAPGGFSTVTDFKTPSDVGIFFEFQLKGIAVLGGRLDSLLEDAIPGYRQREDIIGL
jgi:LPS-assembly protein